MKIVVAGEGAFGRKHLEALSNIPDVEVVSLAGGVADATKAVAADFSIPHWSLDLGECLAQPGVDAAILVTPTPVHAAQAMQVLDAVNMFLLKSRWPTTYRTQGRLPLKCAKPV